LPKKALNKKLLKVLEMVLALGYQVPNQQICEESFGLGYLPLKMTIS